MRQIARNPVLSPISKRKAQIQAKNDNNKYVEERKREQEVLLQDKDRRRMLWRKRLENNPLQIDELALWAEEEEIIKERERQKYLLRRRNQATLRAQEAKPPTKE